MKRSYAIAILVPLILVAVVFCSYELPKPSVTLYSKGEKVGDSGFYFDGFTYLEAPRPTPPINQTPPPFTPHLVLTAVFKPTSKFGPGGISEPTEFDIGLNLNGNTTTLLGDQLDNEFYTIISYNLAQQTILMAYG